MLTPERWAMVAGLAFAVVALVGLGQILLGGGSGFSWVLVGVAVVSAVAAFVVATAHRRRSRT